MRLAVESHDIARLYIQRFSERETFRKYIIWKVICKEYLQRFIADSYTVVDVGCGAGEFINNIKAARKIAIDLNPNTRRFLERDVEFYQCSATDLSSLIRGGADVIFTSNFLEHLPDKNMLNLFFDSVMEALKPGGSYLILGPNIRYLPGKYWDFYDHHIALTHLSLCEALRLKDFEIELCIDRFLPYTTKTSLPTHPLFVWLYLKLPPVWRFLGKQFFIVARKRSQC